MKPQDLTAGMTPDEFAAFLKTLGLKELIDMYRDLRGSEYFEMTSQELKRRARATSDRTGREWGKDGIAERDGKGRP